MVSQSDEPSPQLPPRRAGAGAMPRELANFSLPLRRTHAPYWHRRNGDWQFTLTAGAIAQAEGPPVMELPSGKLARAAMMHLCTQARLSSSDTIDLGGSYREYMEQLGVAWGGKSRADAVHQLKLLAAATFSITAINYVESPSEGTQEVYNDMGGRVAESMTLWTRADGDLNESRSQIVLTPMFRRMVETAVPVNQDAWSYLMRHSKSAMPLDIYTWLCSRLHGMTSPSRVTWNQLHEQFGSSTNQRQFKQLFRGALDMTKRVFPEAKVEEASGASQRRGFRGLVLSPSPDPRDAKVPAD